MKVCIISSGSFEKNYSSYHLMRDMITNLQQNDCQVTIIQKYYQKQGVFPLEIDIKRLTSHEIKVNQNRKTHFARRLISELVYYLRAMKYIKQEKDSDVFFLQSNNVPYLPIWLIRKITRKPIVYNVQDIFPQNAFISGVLNENSIIGSILRGLQRWSLKNVNSIITISEDMKKTLIEAGADESIVSIAYNWANEVQGELITKTDDKYWHVVYAGNIGMMQNVETIVKAACLLQNEKDIHFDIYGAGARKEYCQKLAHEIDNISFYDPVPANQACNLYMKADVNVIPLAKGIVKTALPSKIAICLRCGKPIIFCLDEESRFASQIQNDISHCVVPPEEESELARVILMLKQGKIIQHIPNERIDQFDRQANLAKYYEVLVSTCYK